MNLYNFDYLNFANPEHLNSVEDSNPDNSEDLNLGLNFENLNFMQDLYPLMQLMNSEQI